MLRRRINALWKLASAAERSELKALLLQRAAEEPDRAAKRAIVSAICAVAKHQVRANAWPELMSFTGQATASSDAAIREMGVVLLSGLVQALDNALSADVPALCTVFSARLYDQEWPVRQQALSGLTLLLVNVAIPNDIKVPRDIVPAMLQTVQGCVEAGAEDVAIDALAAMSDMVESDLPLNAVLPELITLCIQLLGMPDVTAGVRIAASYCVNMALIHRPRAIIKAGLLQPLVKTLFELLVAHAGDPALAEEADVVRAAVPAPGASLAENAAGSGLAEADEESDSVVCTREAARLLDAVASNLPESKVWKVVGELVLFSAQQASWQHHRAACIALAQTAEGVANALLPNMAAMVRMLAGFISTKSGAPPAVREAALWALGQLAENLRHHVARAGAELLPVILPAVTDPHPVVAEKGVYVLRSLLSELNKATMVAALPSVMPVLGSALQHGTMRMQEIAIAALGSVAIACERDIQPHALDLIQALAPFMTATGEHMRRLKAEAVDCAGHVVAAAGPAAFAQITEHHDVLAMAADAANTGEPVLLEAAMSLFGNVASVLKEQFTPLLQAIVPLAVEMLESTDGQEFVEKLKSANVLDEGSSAAMGWLGEGEDDDDDDEGDKRMYNYRVKAAVIDMKQEAIATLGALANHTRAGFAPFIKTVWDLGMSCAQYHAEELRAVSVTSLKYFVLASAAAEGGCGAATAALVNQLYSHLAGAIRQDEDSIVVSRMADVVRALVDAPELGGAAHLGPHLDPIMQALVMVLARQTECQQVDVDSEEEEEDPEFMGHDGNAIDCAADAVTAIASSLGPAAFAEYWHATFLTLAPYLSGSAPDQDWAMAVGMLGEMASHWGSDFDRWRADSLEAASLALRRAEGPMCRRNAAFGFGVLASQAGNAAAQRAAGAAVELLQPQLTPREVDDDHAVADNAVAALARISRAHPDQLPAARALQLVLPNLPLQSDLTEDEAVWDWIVALWQARDASALSALPQLLPAIAKMLDPARETDEAVITRVAAGLASIAAVDEAGLTAMLGALPADQSAAIVNAVRAAAGQAAIPSPTR